MRILRCRYLYERVYVKTYCIFRVAYIGEMFLGDLLKLPTIVCWVHMTQGALAIKCLPSWETRHDFSIRLPVDKDHVKKKDVSFYPSSDWAVHTTFNQSKWCSITILSPPIPLSLPPDIYYSVGVHICSYLQAVNLWLDLKYQGYGEISMVRFSKDTAVKIRWFHSVLHGNQCNIIKY